MRIKSFKNQSKNKQMKTLNKNLFLLLFLSVCMLNAQTKLEKTNQTIKVNKDVTLDLNTSHCTIELDTWNKDSIEIEAYIEGEKISKEELQEALKNWKITIDATTDYVSINSVNNRNQWLNEYHNNNHIGVVDMNEFRHEIAAIPEIHMEHIQIPKVPKLPKLPKLPKGLNNVHFDYDAYKKDGEKYLAQWSEKFDKKFGKEFEEKMKVWGEKFEEKWGKEYGEKMKEWGKRFEEKNKHLQERIEERAELLEERHEKREELLEKRNEKREALIIKRNARRSQLFDNNSNIKKTIKIKIPKKAKVKLNVRHGELNLASNINNLDATISYTKLVANSINGNNTSINASYSPLSIQNWKYGKLNLNYVENATISNVESLIVTSNFSNIEIKKLLNNAIIDSSYGDLKILTTDDSLTNLNVIVQNGDATIMLPNTDHNLLYQGKHSRLKHHKNNTKENISIFTDGNVNSPKRIVINAKYSTVTMK